MSNLNIPIECKLPDLEAREKLANWETVRGHVSSVVQLKNGISATVSGIAAQTISDLAVGEEECCPSMVFELDESGGELGIRITSERSDMIQSIKSMFYEGVE
jgi:hypothetical protein